MQKVLPPPYKDREIARARARAGTPLELVARQLGHRDVVMVARVYGRFSPNRQERDRWEAIAAALDAEKSLEQCTNACTTNEKALERKRPSAWEDDSRGGTRTLDPGIMSAVL